MPPRSWFQNLTIFILLMPFSLENDVKEEAAVPYYYCGEKTFSATTVSVSRSINFVTDIKADSKQNLTTDTTSFIVDVTGCVTPIRELKDAIGIEIQFQYLPIIYSGAIQNLLHLHLLKMEYCDIKKMHPNAFLQLPSIHTMFLRFNRIERIEEGIFNNLNIRELYLNNNSISYIDPAAFNDMPNLSLIELDGNKLKTWNTDWFTNTPNVEHLSMDSNQLERLPANAFKKLKNYYSTSIRLSNNRILYIHPTAFKDLNLLYALWLDNNHIRDLNDEVFRYFERIYVLSLSGNMLTCLSEEMLYSFQSKDLILHVENNELLNCECLRLIEKWARMRSYLFTEQYAREECDKKRDRYSMSC